MPDSNSVEQLMLLKDLTRRTGLIYEAQVLQLKYWPMLALTHAKSSEVRLNVEKRVCEFFARIDSKGKAPDDLADRLARLDEAVKWLLGDEWLVKVKLGKKIIYRSTAKAKEEKAA
jgi:hypothetical protein